MTLRFAVRHLPFSCSAPTSVVWVLELEGQSSCSSPAALTHPRIDIIIQLRSHCKLCITKCLTKDKNISFYINFICTFSHVTVLYNTILYFWYSMCIVNTCTCTLNLRYIYIFSNWSNEHEWRCFRTPDSQQKCMCTHLLVAVF